MKFRNLPQQKNDALPGGGEVWAMRALPPSPAAFTMPTKRYPVPFAAYAPLERCPLRTITGGENHLPAAGAGAVAVCVCGESKLGCI